MTAQKASARNATNRHHGSKKSRTATDVFSDDDDPAVRQERAMNARADVDTVGEDDEPTFALDDSEVDEDEAFQSEDEDAYGLCFSTKKKEEEEDQGEEQGGGDLLSDLLGTAPAGRLSTGSDDDDDDDVEEGERIKKCSEFVDTLVETKRRKQLQEIDAQLAHETTDGEVTLGALLRAQRLKPGAENADEEEAIEKTTTGLDLRRMRQQVRELEEDGRTLTLRATRNVVQDARAERRLVYVEKGKDVDVFEPVVRRNRVNETLDLRRQAPKLEKLTPAVLANKFVAQTALEKSVANLLQASDWSDKTVAQDEEAELAQKHVSVHEVAARQKELAKLRSLLFYEEQKKKRVKKIKSKLYHKIRTAKDKQAMTRQQEALRAMDPALARQLDDELAAKRAEERLTLKHRNTSKWVKHQLRRGIQADDATRSAIADQLRRGEELRQKMDAVDSEDEDLDNLDDEEAGDAVLHRQTRLEKQAEALVTEIEHDTIEASKTRGLHGMKFMQRAAEKQREKARIEATKLLCEIRTGGSHDKDHVLSDGEEDRSSADDCRRGTRQSTTRQGATKPVVVTEQVKAAVAKALAGNALQTASVSMQCGVAARASGAIAIDLGDGGSRVAVAATGKALTNVLELGGHCLKAKTVVASASEAKTDSEDMDNEPAAQGGENPWLSRPAPRSKRRQKTRQTHQCAQADLAAAIESLAPESTTVSNNGAVGTLPRNCKRGQKRTLDQDKDLASVALASKKNKSKVTKDATQDELVRRAFEFVASKDNELALEKDRLAEHDAKAKHGAAIAQLVGMSGWGSWAGAGVGVSKHQLAREQKAQTLAREAKQKALARRIDARLERVLINEKKDTKAAKFMLKNVPYPFTSRQEYEAAMRNPLGSDWNTAQVTNVLTAPKIMKHAGTTIAPLRLSKEERKVAKKELGLKRKAKF